MRIYESMAPPEFRQKILSGSHFSLQEIQDSCQFLLPHARTPHSHPHEATPEEEKMIKETFEDLHIGSKRMKTLLSRKKLLPSLSLAQIR